MGRKTLFTNIIIMGYFVEPKQQSTVPAMFLEKEPELES